MSEGAISVSVRVPWQSAQSKHTAATVKCVTEEMEIIGKGGRDVCKDEGEEGQHCE